MASTGGEAVVVGHDDKCSFCCVCGLECVQLPVRVCNECGRVVHGGTHCAVITPNTPPAAPNFTCVRCVLGLVALAEKLPKTSTASSKRHLSPPIRDHNSVVSLVDVAADVLAFASGIHSGSDNSEQISAIERSIISKKRRIDGSVGGIKKVDDLRNGVPCMIPRVPMNQGNEEPGVCCMSFPLKQHVQLVSEAYPITEEEIVAQLEMPKRPRVIDACNVTHNARLPVAVRRDFVRRLHELLWDNTCAVRGTRQSPTSASKLQACPSTIITSPPRKWKTRPASKLVEKTSQTVAASENPYATSVQLKIENAKTESVRSNVTTESVKLNAADIEHKIFLSQRTPSLYQTRCINLVKHITDLNSRGVRFDFEKWMDPKSPKSSLVGNAADKGGTNTSKALPANDGIQVSDQVDQDGYGIPYAVTHEADVDTIQTKISVPYSTVQVGGLNFYEMPHCRVCMVDDANTLKQVVTLLEQANQPIACDIEGVNLGQHGRTATVQLSVANSTSVFIVDVAVLKHSAFDIAGKSLRSLLEDSKIEKLMWDCRSDTAVLFFEYGVRIQNVVDLQLLHVARMKTYGKSIFRLSSLGRALDSEDMRAHMKPGEADRLQVVKDEAHQLFAPDQGGSYAVWLERPIRPILLEYATDCVYFGRLRSSLNRKMGVWFAGVEEIFGDILSDAAASRVSCAISGFHNGSDSDTATKVDAPFVAALEKFLSEETSSSGAPAPRARSIQSKDPCISESPTYQPHPELDVLELKRQIAGVVTRLLQPHFKKRIKTKRQFKELAQSMTKTLVQLFRLVEGHPDPSEVEREAASLVRSKLCDLDPLSL